MKHRLRTKRKAKSLGNYDSTLEQQLHESTLKDWDFHTLKINYKIEHDYHTDFIKIVDGITFICEAKGVFWDSGQASKYKAIKNYLNDDQVFFFLFGDARKPLMWSKKRKDGSKSTHEEWCIRNGFLWYDLTTKPIPDTSTILLDYAQVMEDS